MQFIFSESAKKDFEKLPKIFQSRLKTKLLYWQNTKTLFNLLRHLLNILVLHIDFE